MTTYTFNPNPQSAFVNWDDSSIWIGGVVPDSPDAVVLIPEVTVTSSGQPYLSLITLSSGRDDDVGSVSIAENFLIIDGSLAVAGDLSIQAGGEIDMSGALSFDTLENDGTDIQGNGKINGSGLLTNNAEIVGDGLTLTLAGLTNKGSLLASGDLTVNVKDGGFTNLIGTTLTGGTYIAGLDPGGAEILYLNVGNEITADAADIVLQPGGDIDVYNNSTQQYVSIQSTLNLITSAGQLSLDQGTYDFPSLTVDGDLKLSLAKLTSADLAIDADGEVSGGGTLSGTIIDNGTLIASNTNAMLVQNADDLIVAGTLSGARPVEIAGGSWVDVFLRSGPFYADGAANAGTLELGGVVTDNVDFLGDVGALIIDNPNNFTGAIATDGADDQIEIRGISLKSVVSYSYTGNSETGALIINTATSSYSVKFIGNFDTANFTLSTGPQTLSTSPPSLLISNSGSPYLAFTSFSYYTDRTQTISGTIDSADAGRDVSLYDGSTLLETVPTSADGKWSATVVLTPPPGAHYVTAQATSAAGNLGVSDPILYTLGPTLAITSAGGETNQSSQSISGAIDVADTASTVSIYDGATLLGTATPDAGGDWSATVDLPAPGPQSITARASTSAGVVGTSAPVAYTLFDVQTVTPGPGARVYSGDGYVKLLDLSGDDTLVGGSSQESLQVFTGDNKLIAGSGQDTLRGGAGDDTLIGGGRSRLVAGAGRQTLKGGFAAGAADTLIGGSGHDTLKVFFGDNKLVARSGRDTLRGGSGNDTLVGGAALSAKLVAGSGNQKLVGGSGDDTIVSGGGNERILGGSGAATINVGLKGDDTITGGAGAAVLHTQGGGSEDPVVSTQAAAAGFTIITFANGQVLTVEGVTVETAGGGNFHT